MLIQKPRMPIRNIVLIGFLPGFLKKFVYRIKGYKIGEKVRIGFGSVICGKDVSIGDYSNIGFLTVIRGDKITIGSHVSIGSTTILDTPYLEIGDESKINEQVFVGGLQFHNSKFVLGKNCQVQQMSFINPARSIIIGDDSAIGGDCLLFGHTSWLSCFDGYPAVFEPIEVGKNVAISWRVFLVAGAKIGDGSVIAPESLVNRTIPPKSLAAGYPARVVSKFPDFPKAVSEEQKVDMLRNIVVEMIAYFTGSGLKCVNIGDCFEITYIRNRLFGSKKKRFFLVIAYDSIPDVESLQRKDQLNVLVSLRTISEEVRKEMNARGVMWLDIEKKERPLFWNDLGDEVALFLRRYGVRFLRVSE